MHLIGWPRFPIASVRLRQPWGVHCVCTAWGRARCGCSPLLTLRGAQCLGHPWPVALGGGLPPSERAECRLCRCLAGCPPPARCSLLHQGGSSRCVTLSLTWGWAAGAGQHVWAGLDGGSAGTLAQVDTCSFFHAGVLPRRGAAPSQPLGPDRPGPAPAAAAAQPAPGVSPSPVSALPAQPGSPGPRAALPAPAATPGSAQLAPAVTSGPRSALPTPAITSGPRSVLSAPAAAPSPRSAQPASAATPGSALQATVVTPKSQAALPAPALPPGPLPPLLLPAGPLAPLLLAHVVVLGPMSAQPAQQGILRTVVRAPSVPAGPLPALPAPPVTPPAASPPPVQLLSLRPVLLPLAGAAHPMPAPKVPPGSTWSSPSAPAIS